jgi:HD-GYP domain-containing protein (c-di-GMP phosphodiesterase class II)
MMEIRDPATAAHARAVAWLALRVGRLLRLSGEALAALELAASFHDLGKAAIPDRVLLKPGPLDLAEWRLVTRHAEWGAVLLRPLPDCARVATIVLHHHERWDGGGYPDGLVRGSIPRASRIIAVCDAYGAMVSDRPYRAALDPADAREQLRLGAGSQFDPDAVRAFLTAVTPALAATVAARCGRNGVAIRTNG